MATRTVTNEFAVLRYVDGVSLHQRKHSSTFGRYADFDAAELARVGLSNGADLEVQERTEEWEEEVEDVELDQDAEQGDARDES